MKQHRFRLTGPRAAGARLSAVAMRDLLDAVLNSARHAVRLRVDGRDLTGALPAWLDRVSDLTVLPLEAGSTNVVVEAPTLAEAAPDRFAQVDMVSALGARDHRLGQVHAQRILDRRMFVAKAVGRSMETAIPDGSWALFRLFPDGVPPAAIGLDGRRVVVQLRDATDAGTGGSYTIKPWRVAATGTDGGATEIELCPDNPGFKPIRLRRKDGDIRVIAELVEVVG